MDDRLPSRARVEAWYLDVLTGRVTREEANRWAAPYIVGDFAVDDWAVWEALTFLFGVDLPDLEGNYLHDEAQIVEQLEQLRSGPKIQPEDVND